MNRADLIRLADLRIAETEQLFHGGMYDGAYYLAGYAVECGLKACIARRTNLHDFPDRNVVNDSWTHDFEKLLHRAELVAQRRKDTNENAILSTSWDTVKAWRESSRYEESKTKADAEALIGAIDDEENGVLAWIRRYW